MQSKHPKLDVHADKLNTELKINHNSIQTVYILVTYLKYIHDVAYQFIWLLKLNCLYIFENLTCEQNSFQHFVKKRTNYVNKTISWKFIMDMKYISLYKNTV